MYKMMFAQLGFNFNIDVQFRVIITHTFIFKCYTHNFVMDSKV